MPAMTRPPAEVSRTVRSEVPAARPLTRPRPFPAAVLVPLVAAGAPAAGEAAGVLAPCARPCARPCDRLRRPRRDPRPRAEAGFEPGSSDDPPVREPPEESDTHVIVVPATESSCDTRR
ncbi:Uncharacterised protein [Mycobacteroides abscessus subsp. abscessus]|nr:Uncharacterised protein [Mycobacteroides abscessus subsp. abscessus]